MSLAASLLAAALLAPAALGQSDPEPLLELAVKGTPLVRSNDDARLEISTTLGAPAELRVRVTDFDGRTVRELFTGTREAGELVRTWRGSDGDGNELPSGPYRVVATASSGGRTERAAEWITLADRKVYPRRPGPSPSRSIPATAGRSRARSVRMARVRPISTSISVCALPGCWRVPASTWSSPGRPTPSSTTLPRSVRGTGSSTRPTSWPLDPTWPTKLARICSSRSTTTTR